MTEQTATNGSTDYRADPAPGTIVLYTDIICGWSTVTLSRLYAKRKDLGLEDAVRIDHRLFLLEDVNEFAISRQVVDPEIPVLGTIEPAVGFRTWTGDPSIWPVSSLLANEAVHACKAQGPKAAEDLDWALRRAVFAESRCITMLHVVLEVAKECGSVDADRLSDDLTTGRARGDMLRDYRANRERVTGSPHLFLPDGTDAHNPGIELRWEGEQGKGGYPVVVSDDPDAVAPLLQRAAGG